MTDINPAPSWAAVRQLEIGEFALGGANGNMNEQAKSLAARSEFLKQRAAYQYNTLAEANADIANIAANQNVNVVDSGLYYKATAGATSLTKSAFDPVSQIKDLATVVPKILSTENIHDLGYGNYLNNSVSQAQVYTLNYPLTGVCQITVVTSPSTSVKHVYVRYNSLNRFFYKFFNGTTWATKEIETSELKYPGTMDLNDLTNGLWFQAVVGNATSERNYPLSGVCEIRVMTGDQTSQKLQKIYYPSADRNFIRYFNGSTWSVTEDISLKSGSVLKSYLSQGLLNSIPKYFEWQPVASAWSMTYDPATKTLSWPHMLLGASADYASTLRLRVPAGSIQVATTTGYDYIYLDLTNVDLSTGNAALSDIKFGTYSGSGYTQKNNQILLAKIDYAGNIYEGTGVPKITVLGQSPVSAAKDTFRVVKTATQAYFYLPATNGNLIRYRFYRQVVPFDGVSAMSQSDFWRLAEVDAVDANSISVVTKPLAENAEWDCAIRVMGAADHSGGVHGDELENLENFSPYFLIDGCKIAQDATFDGQVKELTFVQETLIYFENTQNVLCSRQKVMTVTKNGIKNYQKLVFSNATNLFTAWLFLGPIRRKSNNDNTGAQITDTAIRFPNYVPENVAEAGFTQVYTDTADGDEFIISGSTSGISIKAKLYGFKGLPKPVTHISSAQFYNKLYFSAIDSRVANYTTSIGETWEVTSEFAIDIK